VFLHGLLGNGRNLNTFAKQVCQLNNSTGYLIDLRGHGKSRIASSSCKNSFENCVKDIAVATKKFSVPVESIVGHSFGGRIALQYAATQQNSSLERVWLLDTVPGQGKLTLEYD
jgi:pimeloyl-ACP methyl ester carboxylesterase